MDQLALLVLRQICATYSAFAALGFDGIVTAWGDPDWGGDSSSVEKELKAVIQACCKTSKTPLMLHEGVWYIRGLRRAVTLPSKTFEGAGSGRKMAALLHGVTQHVVATLALWRKGLEEEPSRFVAPMVLLRQPGRWLGETLTAPYAFRTGQW